jgi:hypothetical protein
VRTAIALTQVKVLDPAQLTKHTPTEKDCLAFVPYRSRVVTLANRKCSPRPNRHHLSSSIVAAIFMSDDLQPWIELSTADENAWIHARYDSGTLPPGIASRMLKADVKKVNRGRSRAIPARSRRATVGRQHQATGNGWLDG